MCLWKDHSYTSRGPFGLCKALSVHGMCRQRRLRPGCADALADLNLCWLHMFEDTVLPGAAHIKCGSLFAGYFDDSSESHSKSYKVT